MQIPYGAIVQAIASVLTAIISGVVLKMLAQQSAKNDMRYQMRIKAELLERELLDANAHLTELTAQKLNGQKINGELQKAINHQIECRHALDETSREIEVKHLHEKS